MTLERTLARSVTLSRGRWSEAGCAGGICCACNAPLVLVLQHGRGSRVSCRRRELRRWAVAAGAVSNISATGLSNTRLCKVSIVLVDLSLHLLEDLVDRSQVATSLCVAHGRKAVGLDWISLVVAAMADCDWLICWDAHA